MRKEYDLSKGERGRFHRPDIELHLPVYLDPDIAEFMQAPAKRKGIDMDRIVNDWLRKSIDFVQTAK